MNKSVTCVTDWLVVLSLAHTTSQYDTGASVAGASVGVMLE